MNTDIWNILHDGSIAQIIGSLPGDIQVAVAIDYLRERFSDPGDCILVTLHGCTAMSYQRWNFDQLITDLAAIAAAAPEILSAEDPTTIICTDGILRIHATNFSLALDGGRTITLAALRGVAEAYWTELGNR